MGLFDKKYCDVCGEKIGLLGNRKLEDGNLCKNCASKLSPWFTGRRHSALEDIKRQLALREENRERVAAFRATRTFGQGYQKLYVDEVSATFAVCRDSDWKNENPDIIPLSCVRNCDSRRNEHRTERKYKDKDGKPVSYNPPQYDYSYDFDCMITLDHPYIDEITFQVNNVAVKQGSGIFIGEFERSMREYQDLCNEIIFFFRNYGRTAAMPAFQTAAPAGADSYRSAPTEPAQSYQAPAAAYQAPVYQQPAPVYQQPAQPAQQAAPVSERWFCPECGSQNMGGKFCQSCGTRRP